MAGCPPAAGLVYADYISTLRTLLLTTQDPGRTRLIIQAVLRQAIQLDKTARWIEGELKFEGMLTGVDRADSLLLELRQAGGVNDQLLDRYNERINRFASDEP